MLVEKEVDLAAGISQVTVFVGGDGHDSLKNLIARRRLHEQPATTDQGGQNNGRREPLP